MGRGHGRPDGRRFGVGLLTGEPEAGDQAGFISRTYSQRPGRRVSLAGFARAAGVAALALALVPPAGLALSGLLLDSGLAWGLGVVAAGLSLVLTPVGLISGALAVWKPAARRQGAWGLAASTASLVLWVLYTAWLMHVIMSADSM